MIWRVEDQRSTGAKAKAVVVLTLDADEMDELLDAELDDAISFNVDLHAARAALARRKAGR
jgi:hypothetical protein